MLEVLNAFYVVRNQFKIKIRGHDTVERPASRAGNTQQLNTVDVVVNK